jgi:hypothetical protein
MGEYRLGRYLRSTPSKSTMTKARSILVINPNSTEQMTDGLKPLVDLLHFKDVYQHCYLTYICSSLTTARDIDHT